MATTNPQRDEKPREDFSLKETSPNISSRRRASSGPITAFDLVENMHYLYVRVVKARNLKETSTTSTTAKKNGKTNATPTTPAIDPYVELRIGNFKGTTQHLEGTTNPEWNQVFAFSNEIIQSEAVEIMVKDKKANPGDDIHGRLKFDIAEVPKRVPPDSALAPQWYRLEDPKGVKVTGELMLALWKGTQADEAFPDAWHSDAAMVTGHGVSTTRSKVYLTPRLWYLRVNVIEAHDLLIRDKSGKSGLLVKITLGNMILISKVLESKSANPMWNEEFLFTAAEPFEEPLVLSVEETKAVNHKKDGVCLGKCVVSLQTVTKRETAAAAKNVWYNLESPEELVEGDGNKSVKFASKIHLRISLDGGYHVLEEPTCYISDLRPTSKSLWKPTIGVLELGILSASGLLLLNPNNKRVDAYCVAKYGQKWVRTRTIANSFAPKWNEQYTWEVYDPCTVISIGVFDNGCVKGPEGEATKDLRIGKVRIRLSTLETNRIYTLSYPLVVLQPSGVKKMGEIQLAVRFSCSSYLSMLQTYTRTLLPLMHYILPLSVAQVESLRHQASFNIWLRLNRAEPPLRREVVNYMLDSDAQQWSLRRSKANHARLANLFGGLVTVYQWFDKTRKWTNPVTTVIVHILYVFLLFFPNLILTTMLLYFAVVGIFRYRKRPRNPPHMDTQLSHAYAVNSDELDEEFDPLPTRKTDEILKIRYDRLRLCAGRIQTLLGDLATQGERLQALLSWRDPRATALFVVFCVVAAIVNFAISSRFLFILWGFYMLRHPTLRKNIPSFLQNFHRRMPAKTDSMF
ncbi:hypothetical protein FNV43_RR06067 [Rhamnella rubrinervis]|uniref:C2 domain-containing protein n=1 Tax=Rhamnella rubrinervis TaxID=2594499 RepID=A0A8K0HD93_9ROSA|nr:hypothetical protein FNV43_RR06067 [Rhamnella rubrinervis]